MVEVTADLVLKAYAAGIFPMSEARDDPRVFWVDPEHRGIIPLDEFHISRRLKRSFRNTDFEIVVDQRFVEVMETCAQETTVRKGTWINDEIISLFSELHAMGHAHSVEVMDGDRLVGGLYGVSLGAAFFGESMFSRARDASKLALVHLVERLKLGGYQLLDTQFVTDHLTQFGAREISRETYQRLLQQAVNHFADFRCGNRILSADILLQSVTQTS
jgi:leucyl/phenylalanyl-tRNA--protein transferase